MAYYLLKNHVTGEDSKEIEEKCQGAEISICYENGEQQVLLGEENVTSYLRTEEVGKMASVSSANGKVREKLLSLQIFQRSDSGIRICKNLVPISQNNVIMDGRDIGTTILPNADVKIYLTASADTRAQRRYQELTEKGESCDLEEIKRDIIARDERDMNREVSPLKQAEDAVFVDSSHMGIEEVTEEIIRIYREKVRS